MARTELPGNVQPVKAASILGVHQADLPDVMLKKEGEKVAKDEVIATHQELLRPVQVPLQVPRATARSRASPT